MGSFAPGFEVRSFFDSSPSYFSQADVPNVYKVTISYTGGLKSGQRKATQYIDLSMYQGLNFTSVKDLDDIDRRLDELVRATKDVTKQVNRVADTMSNGIWVQGAGVVGIKVGKSEGAWRTGVLAWLEQLRILWAPVYRSEGRATSGVVSSIKGLSGIIRNQLVAALASPPSGLRAEQIAPVQEVVNKMYQLSNSWTVVLYIGDQTGADKFADELVQLIEVAVAALGDMGSKANSPADEADGAPVNGKVRVIRRRNRRGESHHKQIEEGSGSESGEPS